MGQTYLFQTKDEEGPPKTSVMQSTPQQRRGTIGTTTLQEPATCLRTYHPQEPALCQTQTPEKKNLCSLVHRCPIKITDLLKTFQCKS